MTTMNEPPPPERCVVCDDPENEHFRVHPFTRAGEELPLQMFRPPRGNAEKNGTRLPFDPILRQALLDKGILTTADLKAADEKVNAILNEGDSMGESGGAKK